MSNKLYVGNLSYNVTEDSLKQAFSAFGSVNSCKIIIDRDTNRSKGFGFVEMSSSDEARTVINEMNGVDFDGRAMNVNEAKPQTRNDNRGSRRW